MPRLSSAHRTREETRITILGIHTRGSSSDAIGKMLKAFGIQYPICIDIPSDESANTWGLLFDRYHVQAIPHAFVVDPHGRIAGHGDAAAAMRIARSLVSAGTERFAVPQASR